MMTLRPVVNITICNGNVPTVVKTRDKPSLCDKWFPIYRNFEDQYCLDQNALRGETQENSIYF